MTGVAGIPAQTTEETSKLNNKKDNLIGLVHSGIIKTFTIRKVYGQGLGGHSLPRYA